MTADGTDALEQALALHAMPHKLQLLRDRALPDAVLLLIRIASGQREAIAKAVARTTETPQVVTDAAVLYIEQVLFHESADSYRLLGVRPDARDDTIKEHYRWLMRWLHPDRHPDRWEVAYSERINRAWNTLGTEQRRRDYDARILASIQTSNANAQPTPMPIGIRHANVAPLKPLLSSRTVRKLPMLLFTGLVVFAVASLALLYWMQRDRISADMAASGHDVARLPEDGSSAQKAAFRRSVAFNERVIELSQPIPPANMAAIPLAPVDRASTTTPVAIASKSTALFAPLPTVIAASIPATNVASAVPATAHRDGVTPQDAGVTVPREFASAYAQGDLDRMMRLFAPNAVENRGDVDAIASDYDHLFQDSSSRELRLDALQWIVLPGRIVGSGMYEARIRRNDDPSVERVQGWIQIEAIPIDGRWKIQRILHRNTR